jgi:hypothetical protein
MCSSGHGRRPSGYSSSCVMASDRSRNRDHSSQLPAISDSFRVDGQEGKPARVSHFIAVLVAGCTWGMIAVVGVTGTVGM